MMEGTDVCFSPVLSMTEAPQHPHNAARQTFVELQGDATGPAPRFSATPAAIDSLPRVLARIPSRVFCACSAWITRRLRAARNHLRLRLQTGVWRRRDRSRKPFNQQEIQDVRRCNAGLSRQCARLAFKIDTLARLRTCANRGSGSLTAM